MVTSVFAYCSKIIPIGKPTPKSTTIPSSSFGSVCTGLRFHGLSTMLVHAIIKFLGVFIIAIAVNCCNTNAYAVGATTPFTTVEAESGSLAGGATVVSLTSPPTTEFSSPQLEASGHAYIALTGTGQSVTLTNNTGHTITAINVRECIPDSATGGGITATLDLYVNG